MTISPWLTFEKLKELDTRVADGGATLLTADTTFYVDAGTGSDSNDGLTPSTAFLTIQAAIDNFVANYNGAGYDVTFQLADGAYRVTSGTTKSDGNGVKLITLPGVSDAFLIGNTGDTTQVVISTDQASRGCILAIDSATRWNIDSLTLEHQNGASNFGTSYCKIQGCRVNINSLNFITGNGNTLFAPVKGADVEVTGTLTFDDTVYDGTTPGYFVWIDEFSRFRINGTLDFESRTLNFNAGFVNSSGKSYCFFQSVTFANAANVNLTLRQFRVTNGATLIGTSGIPGDPSLNIIDPDAHVENELYFSTIQGAFDDDAAAGLGGVVTGQLYETTGLAAAPLNVAGIVMKKQ